MNFDRVKTVCSFDRTNVGQNKKKDINISARSSLYESCASSQESENEFESAQSSVSLNISQHIYVDCMIADICEETGQLPAIRRAAQCLSNIEEPRMGTANNMDTEIELISSEYIEPIRSSNLLELVSPNRYRIRLEMSNAHIEDTSTTEQPFYSRSNSVFPDICSRLAAVLAFIFIFGVFIRYYIFEENK